MLQHPTLDECAALLERLPGVTVACKQQFSDSVLLELQIRDWSSLARITFCTGAANVPLSVWSAAGSGAESEDSGHLRFQITAPTEPLEAGWTSNFGILGIRLVWDLHRAGTLSTGEANRMLDAWGGQAV